MREVDRVAVDEVGYPLLSMMENAGRSLAAHALELGGDVTVVCGGGGNGGGGLACARHLHNHGASVRVVLDRSVDEFDPDTAPGTQLAVLREMGVPFGEEVGSPDLVVDALIGYGLADAPRGRARERIEAMDGNRVLSLDVPSGVNATTGARPGASVVPDRTLALALPKTGLVDVGDLFLADIGIPKAVYDRLGLPSESPFSGEWWVELRRVG